jgi:hypothetical protein
MVVCARAPAAEDWNADGGNAPPAEGGAPVQQHEGEHVNVDSNNTYNLHGVHIIAADDDNNYAVNHAAVAATAAESVADHQTSGVPVDENPAAAHGHTGVQNQDIVPVNRGADVRVASSVAVLDASGRTLSSNMRNVTTTASIVQFVVEPGRSAPEMSNLPNVVLQE